MYCGRFVNIETNEMLSKHITQDESLNSEVETLFQTFSIVFKDHKEHSVGKNYKTNPLHQKLYHRQQQLSC